MLNLCPPQQTGFTNSLNCSAAQHKSPAAESPRFLAISQGEPKGTEHHNNSLTLQHGDFHVRHTYLSCHCVKHLEVFLRADPSCWKVFLWNKTLLTSLLAPLNAKSPAPTWLLYHWDAAESILSPLAPAHQTMTLVKALDPDCVSRWSKEAELTHLG